MILRPPLSTLFLYTTLFRSQLAIHGGSRTVHGRCPSRWHDIRRRLTLCADVAKMIPWFAKGKTTITEDRKSTRLNSSHRCISYAVFCLKKKIKIKNTKEHAK